MTTKRGAAGKTTVEYNTYVGRESPARLLPFLTPDQYRNKLREMGLPSAENDFGASTNWFDEITRTAINHNHSLAVSGGTDKFTYRGSLVYLNQPGIAINSGFDRLNGRLNLTQKALDDKLEIQILLSQQVADKDEVDYGAFLTAGRINPTMPIYNPDGTFYQPQGIFEVENPVARLKQITRDNRERQTLGNAKIFIEPIKGLRFGANASLSNFNENFGFFRPSTYTANGNNLAQAWRTDRNVRDQLLELTASYAKTFGIHNLSVLGGYTYQRLSEEGIGALNSSFPNIFGYNNLGAGNANPDGSTNRELYSYKSEARLIGFIGRLNYSLNEKYLLTANIRRDGSSRFGENNRWGWFPAFSAGWRISQEEFMKGIGFLSDLKLRVGYGITGNQDGIPDYASRLLFGPRGSFFTNGGFQTAYGYNQNANPDLKWETSAMTNIGVDFSFLQGRVNGSIELYNKDTRDLLFRYPIARGLRYTDNPNIISVTDQLLANVGQINNKGIELAVDYLVLDKGDFQWRTNANFSHNTNKVVNLSSGIFQYNEQNPRLFGGFGSGQGGIAQPVVLQVGRPIGQFYGPVFEGFGTNEDGTPRYNFRDINGDGTINPFGLDRTYIGSAQPKLVYAWGNTLTYKSFDLTFLFRGALGHQIANGPYIYSANPNRFPGNNALDDAFSTGTPEGLSPAWSSQWVEKADFVRLDNWRFSYKLPQFWKYLSNAQVYLAGNNTFVLTKYRGIDPEPRLGGSRDIYGGASRNRQTGGSNEDSYTGDNLSPGVEPLSFYPRSRIFTLGMSLTF
jgi:iron complex outermembrane receptor protein